MGAVLRRYLRPGAVFIDMGANEGYFSVLASGVVGPSGAVIAVEPQSRLQGVIQTNLDANACLNVRLVRCVVIVSIPAKQVCSSYGRSPKLLS
jgi:FkbM family methyltransferase